MFTRTKRLFGLAAPARQGPILFDHRVEERGPAGPLSEPAWQGDLDSLFHVVDAHMVDRRSSWVPGENRAAAPPMPPASALPPPDPWIGFGIVDQPEPVADAAATPGIDLRQLVKEAVAEAVQEAFDTAIKEQLRRVIQDSVDAALAKSKAARAEETSRSRPVAPIAAVSIRVRQPLFS